MVQRILKRQEMYDLVWSSPMVQLAKQFHLSDNGLRKICRKYKIPMPEGGHWQKIQYGKSVKKPPLLPHGEETIVINIFPQKEKPSPSIAFSEAITVPEEITKFHPLIKQTKKRFASIQNGDGSIDADALDIRISPGQFRRAYRLMDTIIKAIEERGAKVAIDRQDQWKRYTHALIEGEKVHFGLREILRVEKIEPDPKQPWASTQEFVPTGKFELLISDYLGGLRTKWRDSEQGVLEDKITSFLNGLWVAAALLKKRRLERETEQKQQEEAQREHERKLRALEEERKRIQILEEQTSSWKKSHEIRAFVQAAIGKQGAYAPDSEFARWVDWANTYADKIDPLK